MCVAAECMWPLSAGGRGTRSNPPLVAGAYYSTVTKAFACFGLSVGVLTGLVAVPEILAATGQLTPLQSRAALLLNTGLGLFCPTSRCSS
jgi:hypothetical protein